MDPDDSGSLEPVVLSPPTNSSDTVMDWAHIYSTPECRYNLPSAEPSASSSLSRCEQLGADLYNLQNLPPLRPPVPSTDELVNGMEVLLTGDIPFEDGTHLCKKHKPKTQSRRDDPKYWFFNAAKQGCKNCVAFCVERHGIDKNVVSETHKYTAEDFARYNEDDEMFEFLQSLEFKCNV